MPPPPVRVTIKGQVRKGKQINLTPPHSVEQLPLSFDNRPVWDIGIVLLKPISKMVAHHADQVQWTINNGKDTNVSNSVKKKTNQLEIMSFCGWRMKMKDKSEDEDMIWSSNLFQWCPLEMLSFWSRGLFVQAALCILEARYWFRWRQQK